MRTTLTQLIVNALSKSKTGMVNAQIAKVVMKKRPGTTPETIDATLSAASKKGVISKKPTMGLMGKSKFVYSVTKEPSVRAVILESLKGKTRIDSMEVLQIVRSVLPKAKKNNVDATLSQMATRGEIVKSKTLMTDDNVISSQSKFVYTGK